MRLGEGEILEGRGRGRERLRKNMVRLGGGRGNAGVG